METPVYIKEILVSPPKALRPRPGGIVDIGGVVEIQFRILEIIKHILVGLPGLIHVLSPCRKQKPVALVFLHKEIHLVVQSRFVAPPFLGKLEQFFSPVALPLLDTVGTPVVAQSVIIEGGLLRQVRHYADGLYRGYAVLLGKPVIDIILEFVHFPSTYKMLPGGLSRYVFFSF